MMASHRPRETILRFPDEGSYLAFIGNPAPDLTPENNRRVDALIHIIR